jgi:hypothetical protein
MHKDMFFDSHTFETISRKPIADNRHVMVNAYANAWYIIPSDVGEKRDYTLILEMTSQRYFYIGMLISVVAISICLYWLGMLLWKIRDGRYFKKD